MKWQKDLKVKRNKRLKDKTTFKIGGKADFFVEPKDLNQLILVLRQAKENNIPVFIIGGGSNLLVDDKGVRGIVIKLSSPYFSATVLKGGSVEAGSGVPLFRLIGFTREKSLKGLEFLAGIPGTLGGALAMNAGSWGKDIGSIVKEVKVLDYSGNASVIKGRQLRFGYRKSSFGKRIILAAVLKLKKGKKSDISFRIRDNIVKKRQSQDLTFSNAGCIFKNPGNISAGKLIDLCGLKGKKEGGAVISDKHANFILNKGKARAADVLTLMRIIKSQVKKKFGIELKPEIKIWS